MKRLAVLVMLLFPMLAASQEKDESGMWLSLYGYKSFGKFYTSLYFEYDQMQDFSKFDSWYVRATGGYKVLPWLKLDAAYDYYKEPDRYLHRFYGNVTATVKSGDLSVSWRERYMYAYTPQTSSGSSVLRSYLNVKYAIPKLPLTPYLAMEVFTWKKWEKTRHYAGVLYSFGKYSEIDLYYLYYTFASRSSEHILGIGYNFNF